MADPSKPKAHVSDWILAFLRSVALSQTYAEATTIFIDKLNAGCLDGETNFLRRPFTPSKFTIDCFKPSHGWL
jgi:hypothetical protein